MKAWHAVIGCPRCNQPALEHCANKACDWVVCSLCKGYGTKTRWREFRP